MFSILADTTYLSEDLSPGPPPTPQEFADLGVRHRYFL